MWQLTLRATFFLNMLSLCSKVTGTTLDILRSSCSLYDPVNPKGYHFFSLGVKNFIKNFRPSYSLLLKGEHIFCFNMGTTAEHSCIKFLIYL